MGLVQGHVDSAKNGKLDANHGVTDGQHCTLGARQAVCSIVSSRLSQLILLSLQTHSNPSVLGLPHSSAGVVIHACTTEGHHCW